MLTSMLTSLRSPAGEAGFMDKLKAAKDMFNPEASILLPPFTKHSRRHFNGCALWHYLSR